MAQFKQYEFRLDLLAVEYLEEQGINLLSDSQDLSKVAVLKHIVYAGLRSGQMYAGKNFDIEPDKIGNLIKLSDMSEIVTLITSEMSGENTGEAGE